MRITLEVVQRLKGCDSNSLTVSDYNTLGYVCQVFYIKFL